MQAIQPNLKLKYSRPVKPMWGTLPGAYTKFRNTPRKVLGVETPRAIQLYRWWFRYLKLALELEGLGHSLEERRRVSKTKKKSGYYKVVREKVIVNRDRYEGWDLDDVLTDNNFNRWWKAHSDLFIERPTHAQEIDHPEDMVMEDHFRYFKVDTRMTINDTIRSMRKHLGGSSNRRSTQRTSKWVPTGEMREEKLLNSYNALVMWLQGKSTKDILSSGLFRMSKGSNISYIEEYGYRGQPVVAKKNFNRLRDLIVPAKRLVLVVADGHFSNHPRNKVYFKG